MKAWLLLPILILLPCALSAQEVIVQRDNGTAKGIYSNMPSFTEESILLQPAGPCTVLEIRVFYAGPNPSIDTLWVVGDPSEGAVPPTNWVWRFNTLISPIVVQYNGQPGWRNIDVRSANLRSDGYDRIVIQHRLKPSGPWFVIDDAAQTVPYSSFLMDPTKTNSLGGPGQYLLPQGTYMVRLLVQYDFPSGSTSQPPPSPTLVDVTKSAGITDAQGNYLKSARASVADWNGDGLDDVAIGSNFFQNSGNGTFQRVDLGIQAGASVWGDYDNDGKIDCYAVNGGAGDKLYRNNGNGTFTDVTAASLLSNPRPTVTPIWLDYDKDGALDLFIANGRTESGGQEQYFPDQLWKNNGNGTFTNVTLNSGLAAAEPAPYYDCWAATASDYDNDGWTDIFVATYRLAPDLLHHNNGNGSFTEVGASTGARGVATADPRYFGHGVGSEFGDLDNDGLLDLVVGNLGHPDWRGQWSNPSLIFMNNGAPSYSFTERRQTMGLKFFEMNLGVVLLDLDLDGWLDIYHCQYSYSAEGSNGEPRRLSRMYLNQGAPSFRLKDVTWNVGSIIHGAWTAVRLDYDRDGDMDLIVASPTDALKLFRNDVSRRGRSLGIRLGGSPGDHVPMDAYGSRITVYADGRRFLRDLPCGGSGTTASQNSNELHFGLGNAVAIDSAVIEYPNGFRRSYTNLLPDHLYSIPYNGNPTTGVDALAQLPSDWRIERARYSESSIRFDLAGTRAISGARLEVFGINGARISSHDLGTLLPGPQAVRTASPLPAGIFFLRLVSDTAEASAKLLVR